MKNLARFALTISALALISGCAGFTSPISAPGTTAARTSSFLYHKTFHYKRKEQSFVVPTGVTSIKVDAHGAAGSGKTGSYGQQYFGRGGRVYAVVAVTPGETLYVYVGGQGSPKGGFNGGGAHGRSGSGSFLNGYGGGGASDVREGGDALNDRIVVAGGGGGQGDYGPAGNGGAGGGETGEIGGSYGSGAQGGGGGTQSAGGEGGAGGQDVHSGYPGKSGALGGGGHGGRGGSNTSDRNYSGGGGGGGGGGYYGGGGGGGGGAAFGSIYGQTGGGGGGGSSYVEPNAVKFRMWRGWKTATGNGLVVISW